MNKKGNYNFNDIYKKIGNKKLPKKEYRELVDKFWEFIFFEKIFKGKIFKLPHKLGYFYIRGKKVTPKIKNGKIIGLVPNWKATLKMKNENPNFNSLIYYTNEHTNFVRYKFIYSKYKAYFDNKYFYYGLLAFRMKKYLSSLIKNNETEFIII